MEIAQKYGVSLRVASISILRMLSRDPNLSRKPPKDPRENGSGF